LVFSLPARARNGILLGGTLFLLGALGVESVNGMILARNDIVVDNAFLYGTMLEELLEMSGVAIAFASLLSLVEYDPAPSILVLAPALLSRVTHAVDAHR